MTCTYCGKEIALAGMIGGGYHVHNECALTIYELTGHVRPGLKTFVGPDGNEYQGWLSTEVARVGQVVGQFFRAASNMRQLSLPEGKQDSEQED